MSSGNTTPQPSRWLERSPRRLLLALGGEVLLYVFALGLLQVQGWGARDVVWSLWSTSLITGYMTIVIAIFGGGWQAWRQPDGATDRPPLLLSLLGLLLFGGFLLAFFTVHFGMFHAVHALFLNSFFPLDATLTPGADLPGQTLQFLQLCLSRYPGFIALCVLAQLPEWLRAQTAGATMAKQGMMRPYANVVKLHLMIIAIGFSQALDIQAAALIAFLGVYFLPLGALWRHLRTP